MPQPTPNARRTLLAALLLLGASLTRPAEAKEAVPRELQGVTIDAHLGDPIPLDLTFTNDRGERVALRKFFDHQRPVVVMLVYYSCPTLCNFLLNGFNETLKELKYTPGQQFEVLTISIDPAETYQLAALKKENHIKDYGRPEAAAGWHWFVGQQEQIEALADALGFRYNYNPVDQLYAHPPAIYVLTPEGNISRYFGGIQFEPRDLKLALLEASEGKIGSVIDQLILFCYHYDPQNAKYSLFAMRIMRWGGGLTLLVLASLIGMLIWRERRRTRRALPAAPAPPPPAAGLNPS